MSEKKGKKEYFFFLQSRMTRNILLLLLCVAVIIAVKIFLKQQDELAIVNARKQELLDKKAEVEKKYGINTENKEQISKLTLEEIEAIARKELGMVKPDEIIFKQKE